MKHRGLDSLDFSCSMMQGQFEFYESVSLVRRIRRDREGWVRLGLEKEKGQDHHRIPVQLLPTHWGLNKHIVEKKVTS